jgi:hypothetical protein
MTALLTARMTKRANLHWRNLANRAAVCRVGEAEGRRWGVKGN